MRKNFINVRLNDDELNTIDRYRKETKLSRSTYMRETAIGNPPRIIPSINRDQWIELSRLASNLNQIAYEAHLGHFHSETEGVIKDTQHILRDVRNLLVGG